MSRILLVIPTLDRSGAEKQFALLALGLKDCGDDVHVLALTRGGSYEETLVDAGIPVTILQKRSRFDFATLRKLRSIISEEKPDVVLSCLFAANASVRLATIGMGAKRPPILISERCVDSWKSGWQLWLDRRLQSRTELLIGNSESVAEFYQQQGFPEEKIAVIPNGVPVPPVPKFSKEEFCKELGLPEDFRLIAFVGRLAPQKRIRDLLWAMQMMRHTCPNAYLLIIGDGPQRGELEQYARECEADTNTRFLGHRDDAASLLHLIDVFWLASEFEGMSNSLMEAMSCGKPVIASDIPPNRELVTHGKDGWLVNLGDSAGFTQYTVKSFQEAENSAKLGEEAARKMGEVFSVEKMIDRYAEAIDKQIHVG